MLHLLIRGGQVTHCIDIQVFQQDFDGLTEIAFDSRKNSRSLLCGDAVPGRQGREDFGDFGGGCLVDVFPSLSTSRLGHVACVGDGCGVLNLRGAGITISLPADTLEVLGEGEEG